MTSTTHRESALEMLHAQAETQLKKELTQLFTETSASELNANISHFVRMKMVTQPNDDGTEDNLFQLLFLMEKLPAIERLLMQLRLIS